MKKPVSGSYGKGPFLPSIGRRQKGKEDVELCRVITL